MPRQHPPAPRIIAHRGASAVAPENTLAAFRAAGAAGAQGVEFDVQLSRDGVAVVIHDERLERTTDGRGWVGEHSAAELAALDAGAWFDPPLRGEGVPTLAAVLAVLAELTGPTVPAAPTVPAGPTVPTVPAPAAMEIHIELKTAKVRYPGLVPAVLAAVAESALAGRVVLSSYNHHSLLEARRRAPHLPCAALIHEVLVQPWDYVARHGLQALHVPYAAVDAELVRGCHDAGLAVRTYTVDDPQEAERLRALGVDGIISNDPARLLGSRRA